MPTLLTSSPPLLPRLYLSVLCNKIIKEDSALHCGRQRSPQTLETRIKRKHPASKDGNSPGSDTAPKNGSPLENEPAIRKRPCNKRKHRTSTNDNPLGSDTPPEDGSPLESEPAIRKRPCHKQKHRASKDGNPLGSDSAPKDGSPLEREPLTPKRKPRSGSNKEKNNPKRRK